MCYHKSESAASLKQEASSPVYLRAISKMSVLSLGLLLKGVAVISSVLVFHGYVVGHKVDGGPGDQGQVSAAEAEQLLFTHPLGL